MSVSTARAFRAASAVLCCLGFASLAVASGADGRALWRESAAGGEKSAAQARSFELDLDGFSALAAKRAGPVALPLAGGGFASFDLEDAGTLDPALAQRYPQLRSLRGRDAFGRRLRLDISPAGVNAMIFADDGVQVIRPHGKRGQHESFARKDVAGARAADRCETDAEPAPLAAALDALTPPAAKNGDTGGVRRTYRLALAATGEYTAAVCAPAAPDTACGLAAMVASINRVNEIYETDLAVRLVLVADNDQLVYTDAATDPYTNGNAAALLDENQLNLTNTLGNGAYDIGHVFGTGNVGRASIGVTCKTGSKARGATGRANPQGDPFDVDFVAHEIGHQFHANHTFNGSSGSCGGSNRVASSAFEPGSGSSIMGYAGLCGAQNLQAHSDPYFHAHSLAEMQAEIAADTCDAELPADNKAALVDTLPEHTIPARTPFALRASASDADGDALTYAWEQLDLGPVQDGAQPDATATDGPLLRSWPPTPDPERMVPNLATLLGAPPAKGEVLPQATRTLAFRASVRDNHPGGGSVNHADTTVHVVDTGAAFAILAPNAPDTAWTCGRDEIVHWDVAGTAQAPIACAAVDVLLSTDGGVAFDRVLASGVPNSGSAVLRVPFAPGANARLQVRCSDNIFFAINAADFTIADAGAVAADDGLTTAPEDVERTIATAALLGNDSGGGALHVIGVSNAVGGSASLVDGAITFVPQADRVGEVGFDYRIADSCERPQPTGATGRVRFDLAPVNDPPVLAPLRDLNVAAQKGASGAIQHFAAVDHFGAADEAGQHVQGYLVSVPDDGDGVVTDVSIDPDGTLRATLGGVTGTATVAVRVRDDGGTAGGGSDTSAERSFTITASDHADIAVDIEATTPTVVIGDSVHYIVTLENTGDTGIAGTHLQQSMPEGVALVHWTCTADDATCPAPAGTGALDLLLPLRAGGRLTFVVSAVVQSGAAAVLHTGVEASVEHDDGTAVVQQSDATQTAVVRRDVFADGMESD
ncbi:reprolysin-like metallopeptidase [Chiayiivirga flava]|uniref:Putative repeat protein (TIGR01451 family) n=1 Tax=Chiayiivirga flava TaxID=659595 RepID=A0A7W8G383_9GAMM|nr:zinc-dependent metalloprotease family protein [Chiayiivirga flava]MBB5209510.1 putative repeat protein (TIGR01451 family) [Chiayiivirga flava]